MSHFGDGPKSADSGPSPKRESVWNLREAGVTKILVRESTRLNKESYRNPSTEDPRKKRGRGVGEGGGGGGVRERKWGVRCVKHGIRAR